MAPGAAVMNLSALGVALAWATVCAILVNIYVTGLNQITDVDIDKINKPYLPIAAGHLSLPAAWAIERCLSGIHGVARTYSVARRITRKQPVVSGARICVLPEQRQRLAARLLR